MKRSTGCARSASLCSAAALALAAFFALFLTGCVSGGGGASAIPRLPDGPAMNLARGLYERAGSLHTLAARGGATYAEGRRRNYVKFEIVMSKPKFLFTAFDPAGRPAFRLAFDGEEIFGLNYGSREYIRGLGNVEQFGAFLPLDISPEQLLAIVSGGQIQPAAAGAGDFDGRATELLVRPVAEPDDEEHLWRVKVLGELAQDPQKAVLESAAYGPARKPLMTFRYNAVKPVPREDLGGRPEPFPHSIEAEWLEKSLRLSYDEVRLGLALSDDLFSLERPQGFQLIQLP